MLTESHELGLNLHPPRHVWDDEEENGHRFHVAGPAVILLIIAVLGGAIWYFYPTLRQEGLIPSELASLPAQLTGVKNSLGETSKRLDATEQKTTALVSAWDGLSDQVNKLQGRLDSNLRAVRQQTQQLVEHMQQQVQTALDRRVHGLETRVIRVEAGQESDQVHVARLEKELASVREDYHSQIVRLEQERDRSMDRVDHQLAGLDQRVQSDSHDLAAVRSQVDRQRVDFEAGLNHRKDLAPGITLQVNHTDVSYQRFDGYVFLMPDRRTVWVHNQSVQEPVVLYSKEDGRSRELIITRVTKYSVVGYVLVPEGKG